MLFSIQLLTVLTEILDLALFYRGNKVLWDTKQASSLEFEPCLSNTFELVIQLEKWAAEGDPLRALL